MIPYAPSVVFPNPFAYVLMSNFSKTNLNDIIHLRTDTSNPKSFV